MGKQTLKFQPVLWAEMAPDIYAGMGQRPQQLGADTGSGLIVAGAGSGAAHSRAREATGTGA